MKTKQLNSVLTLLLILCFSSSLFSQNSLSSKEKNMLYHSVFNAENVIEDIDLNALDNKEITINYLEEDGPEETLMFAKTMLALGAGFGFGDDQTLWCLHAAYYMQLALFSNSAFYGSFGAVYNGFSNDGFKQNIIDLQLQFLMYTAISKLNEIRLIYGILGGYGFGNEKFDSFKTDITRFTLAAVIGFQLMFATSWSLAIQTNLLTYQSSTFKPESGGEFKNDFTNVLVNKNNLLTISLLFHLGAMSR